jgi:hypothetical protein
MAKYYDLNSIVKEYLVENKPALEDLTSRLRHVPISLKNFEAFMKQLNSDLYELQVRAELTSTEIRILLLDELSDTIDEADEIAGRMVMPYPSLWMSGEHIRNDFYRKAKSNLGSLILPNPSDSSAKVLSRKGLPGVAVLFDDKDKRHGNLNYLEINVIKEF